MDPFGRCIFILYNGGNVGGGTVFGGNDVVPFPRMNFGKSGFLKIKLLIFYFLREKHFIGNWGPLWFDQNQTQLKNKSTFICFDALLKIQNMGLFGKFSNHYYMKCKLFVSNCECRATS